MSCPVTLQELKLTFEEIWNKIYIAPLVVTFAQML